MWYVVLIFKDDIFKSDFMRSFMQFQHHNITSDKLSLSLMCAYYGVAVVVFVINIFFYFIRINVSEHVENKSNCSTIMKISYLLHISLKKSFSKSFLAFFLILELKSM